MHGTDFKRPIYGGDRFRELEYHYDVIVWVMVQDPNNAIDIGEWSICGSGRLERFEYIIFQQQCAFSLIYPQNKCNKGGKKRICE